MARDITWRGTQTEAAELLSALNRHCNCEESTNGMSVSMCATHLLLDDQRALDRLLFARRIASRFLAEEFGVVRSESPTPK